MTVEELIEKLSPFKDKINQVQFESRGDIEDVIYDFGEVTIISSTVPIYNEENDSINDEEIND